MKVLSVNTGLPRELPWKNGVITTAIFKAPLDGAVSVNLLNLAGDRQADLTVHGGEAKAVYFYPHEHYSYWQTKLQQPLSRGNFGENLTTEGVSEEELHIGDELQIGTALFRVRQPRTPCWKLGVRFDRDDMTRMFYESRRFGAYFSVLGEGTLQAGDEIRILHRDPSAVTVADVIGLYTGDRRDPELLDRLQLLSALPESWRRWLRERPAEQESVRRTT